jgi:glycopeptide antibiotics resistance protein
MRHGWAALSAITLAAILVATLTPSPDTTVTASVWCLTCGELVMLDVVANIVMFLPLGFALAATTNRRWLPVLFCVATTVIVESLQVRVVAGRDASLRDVLCNSLGGIIGVELALRRQTLFRPDARIAARLAIVWASVFALVCALTSAGLRPATVPRSLWVQRTPARPSFEPFAGRVLGVALNGVDLPQYPPKSMGVDGALRASTWHVTASISADGLQPRRSVIARIAEEFTVLVSIEQLGWDLACQEKLKASDFWLRSPKVALRKALLPLATSEAPVRASVACGRSDGTLVAETQGGREVLRLSPSLGWLLVSPFDVALSSRQAWIGALWLLALAFPAGYWAGAVRDGSPADRRRGLLVAISLVLALAVGLTIAPALAGTALGLPWEWGASVAGLVLGATGSVVAHVATRSRRS